MRAAVVLLLSLAGVVWAAEDLRPMSAALPKNVSGFLVNRGGQFYLQPVFVNESAAKNLVDQQLESDSRGNEEESWSETEEEKDESGLPQTTVVSFDYEEKADDDSNIEDEPSWQKRPKSWWQQLSTSRSRARGFSLFGAIESAFSSVTKFLGNFIGDDDDEADAQSNAVSYKDYQMLRITPKSQRQVRHLQELKDNEPDDVKFWTVPAKDKATDLVVSPVILKDVKEFLQEKKIEYTILVNDLQKLIKSQNPRMPKERRQDLYSLQGHSMTWKRYHRYKDIMGYLDYLASKYPQLVEVFSIGKSFEGRALKVIKVSTGAKRNGEPKSSIWIDAGMHAREWISTAVATYILNQLVERNENYTRLLDLTDWIIMPIANPDGYEFTHTDDRLWRKTRSIHDSDSDESFRQAPGIFNALSQYTKWLFGTCEGVDPNRNFNIHWGESKIAGASKDPCHETYGGPSPFSEPETRAMSNYIMNNKKTIRTYLTLHSYSQMLLVPWGFTRTRPADFQDLMNIATKAKKAMAKVHGTDYKVGPAAELLYPTTGSSDDWAKAIAGIKNSFTLELRDRGFYGFLLPASQIVPTARETWAGVRVIARMAATNT
ncbi:carboxypeptidase A2-like [Nasonia vitripennis]|uniref:Peptidase M14 domain-containing protein n=1 Tax=Nasonia vitripennis TaxID=7425 RepID=A0A7M7G3J7_NASVI|nr:carboxypeptidase A2-like [Nasonia vitripennis]